MNDAYNTIKTPSEGLFKDKGSKFFAHAFPVQSEEEVKEVLSGIIKKYYDNRDKLEEMKRKVEQDFEDRLSIEKCVDKYYSLIQKRKRK